MAILAGGKVVSEGAPEQLRQSVNGQVWRTKISRDALEAFRNDHTVISERLVGGRTVIHVLSPNQPGPDFAPVEGGLEDVYFSKIAASRVAA
jgi:ABC-2 type transport system ATP-binding protein